MYLFFMLQFMFLVFIVARSMHQQGHQVPAKLEKHTLLLLKNTHYTHIVTNIVLKEGYHKLLWVTSYVTCIT